jgi:hypothetical protein
MKGYKGVIDLVTLCDPSVISEEAGFGPLRGRIVEGGKQLFGMYLGCSASRCVWHLFQGRSRWRTVLIVLSVTSVFLVTRHHSMYSRPFECSHCSRDGSRYAQLDQMIAPKKTPGLVFCFRRSSSKIEDPKILHRMSDHHELAMQAVIPLLVKEHDYYDTKFAFLNGIQSRNSPPPFRKYNGWTANYYGWAKVVADAVASDVKILP